MDDDNKVFDNDNHIQNDLRDSDTEIASTTNYKKKTIPKISVIEPIKQRATVSVTTNPMKTTKLIPLMPATTVMRTDEINAIITVEQRSKLLIDPSTKNTNRQAIPGLKLLTTATSST